MPLYKDYAITPCDCCCISFLAKEQAEMMERGKNRAQRTDLYSDSGRANKWEGKAAKTLGVARIAFPIFWHHISQLSLNNIFSILITPTLPWLLMSIWFIHSNSVRIPLHVCLVFSSPWFQKAMKVIMNYKMKRRRCCKMMKINCSTMTSFSKWKPIRLYQSWLLTSKSINFLIFNIFPSVDLYFFICMIFHLLTVCHL